MTYLHRVFIIVLGLIVYPISSVNAKQLNELPQKIILHHTIMKLVPAGEFIMGSNKAENKELQNEFGSINPWYLDEHPQHIENLDAYYINQFEITNSEFKEFVLKAGYMPPNSWMDSGYIVSLKMEKLTALPIETIRKLAVNTFKIDVDARTLSKTELLDVISKHFSKIGKLPVNDVDWFAAESYCEWSGGKLPTEAQWEKAARGSKGNEFPWGNQFESGMSNTGDEDWPMGLTTGGMYQSDKSEYEISDLAGNVSEWVFDWYDAYPNSKFKNKNFGEKFKVVRGAGWGGNGHYALQVYQRGAYRYYQKPDVILDDLGFRCAANTDIAGITGSANGAGVTSTGTSNKTSDKN